MTTVDAATLPSATAAAPPGYGIPAPVARLVDHAHASGWRTLLQWQSTAEGAPFLVVEVGRLAGPTNGPGPCWRYRLTWHSWDLPHGRLRLFRAGVAETPAHPRPHDAPSVTQVYQVIAAHPASPATAGQRPGAHR